MWTPHPADIVVQIDCGTANMGSLAYPEDDSASSRAQFGLDEPYVLCFLRVHFQDLTGSASGTATLTLALNSAHGKYFDNALFQVTSVGDEEDVNLRIASDELMHWRFGAGDQLCLLWTNPDSGNISWGVECGLAPIGNNAPN